MDINQLIYNTDSLNVNEAVENAFIDISKNLIDAQKDQLIHGQLSTGKKTGLYKLKAYEIKKHAMNPLAGLGHKDYKLTGDFQRGIFVDVRATELVFGSLDIKTESILSSKHNDGDNIMGLNKESVAKVEPALQAAAVENIKAQIFR